MNSYVHRVVLKVEADPVDAAFVPASFELARQIMRRQAVHGARSFDTGAGCPYVHAMSMRDIAYVALGSNLGDRAMYLSAARSALASLPGSRILATSSVEETPPIGDTPQGGFLNQMVALETTLSPKALLECLRSIEARAGRIRGVRWGPRTLDLDIVCYKNRRVDEPGLKVPHAELPNRNFWQRELAELRDVTEAAG